jgi:hypothetical protein
MKTTTTTVRHETDQVKGLWASFARTLHEKTGRLALEVTDPGPTFYANLTTRKDLVTLHTFLTEVLMDWPE